MNDIEVNSLAAILWVAEDAQEYNKSKISKESLKKLISFGGFFDFIKTQTSVYSFEAKVSEDFNSMTMSMECSDMVWKNRENFDMLLLADSIKFHSASEDSVFIDIEVALSWENEEVL